MRTRSREANNVIPAVVQATNRPIQQSYIREKVDILAQQIFQSNTLPIKCIMCMDRKAGMHSVGEYVRKQGHINGLEGFLKVL